MNTEEIIAEKRNDISQQENKIAELDAQIEELSKKKEQLAQLARKLKAEAMLGENILNHLFVNAENSDVAVFYSVAGADDRCVTLLGIELRDVRDCPDQKLVCPIVISVANRNDFSRQYRLANTLYLNQRSDLKPLFWSMQGLAAFSYKMDYPTL